MTQRPSVLQQARRLNVERSRELVNVQQRNIPFASFDFAHVRPREVGLVGERFLRYADFSTKRFELETKADAGVDGHFFLHDSVADKLSNTMITFQTAGGFNKRQGSVVSAAAIFSMLAKLTFQTLRSTALTYVRSKPHSNANCSCDKPNATRRERMLYANTARRSSGSGRWVGGEGRADTCEGFHFEAFASTEFASTISAIHRSHFFIIRQF